MSIPRFERNGVVVTDTHFVTPKETFLIADVTRALSAVDPFTREGHVMLEIGDDEVSAFSSRDTELVLAVTAALSAVLDARSGGSSGVSEP